MKCEVCLGLPVDCPACDTSPSCADCGVWLTDRVCDLGLDDETPALCWSCDPERVKCVKCGVYAYVQDGTLATCGHP